MPLVVILPTSTGIDEEREEFEKPNGGGGGRGGPKGGPRGGSGSTSNSGTSLSHLTPPPLCIPQESRLIMQKEVLIIIWI
jgi:hypothetical protein